MHTRHWASTFQVVPKRALGVSEHTLKATGLDNDDAAMPPAHVHHGNKDGWAGSHGVGTSWPRCLSSPFTTLGQEWAPSWGKEVLGWSVPMSWVWTMIGRDQMLNENDFRETVQCPGKEGTTPALKPACTLHYPSGRFQCWFDWPEQKPK